MWMHIFLLFSSITLILANSLIFKEHSVLKLENYDRNNDYKIVQYLYHKYQCNVYKEATKHDPFLYITSRKDALTQVRRLLSRHHITATVVIEDLHRHISEWMDVNQAYSNSTDWFESYHEFQEIMDWVDDKAESCGVNCEILQLNSNSYEGRVLKVIKIGTPGDNKPKLWIDATIHAREWIAPAVAQYFIERLIDDYNVDADVTSLVDTYDFYIQPVVNPDGYVYTWTDDRLWRKSRLINDTIPDCIGTDLNRNFDFQWNTVGVGDDPCDITWPGYSAFSDPETKAIADFILENGNWTLFLTMHSYSQLWMAPYGYTTEHIPDYDKLIDASRVAVGALEAVYGTEYEYGAASEILYESSGTSRDWAYGVANAEYVYTIELRDKGRYGFELPPEQIKPSVIETWAALKAFMNYISLNQ